MIMSVPCAMQAQLFHGLLSYGGGGGGICHGLSPVRSSVVHSLTR
jgi:hypothetical protein